MISTREAPYGKLLYAFLSLNDTNTTLFPCHRKHNIAYGITIFLFQIGFLCFLEKQDGANLLLIEDLFSSLETILNSLNVHLSTQRSSHTVIFEYIQRRALRYFPIRNCKEKKWNDWDNRKKLFLLVLYFIMVSNILPQRSGNASNTCRKMEMNISKTNLNSSWCH